MKFSNCVIIIILLTASFGKAQVQIDSSNIVRQILQKQIDEIRAGQSRDANKIVMMNNSAKQSLAKQEGNKKEISSSINTTTLKLLILIAASFSAFGFVFIRRKKINKQLKKEILKENIKKLRNEQLIVSIDPRLKAIRKKLVLNSSYLKVDKDKSKYAQNLQIGESELVLAMKLREYQKEIESKGDL